MNNSTFSSRLIDWYKNNKRHLPWRSTRDTYRVWLSEIILQQTRVMQGLPYYLRFIEKFPTLENLAQASEDEVLRLWQGLGYYSRARNLHNCAKILQQKHKGQWPNTFAELVKLPGIGDYTAAAIASFSFKQAVPVVDGNVYRVMSRVFGINQDIASHQAKKVFTRHAKSLIPQDTPDLYNQAIMEFGATICLPQPKCNECIFKQECYAYQNNLQDKLPLNLKKVKVRKRYLYYIVFQYEEKIYMKQRIENDVWRQLYDFYLLEGEPDLTTEKVINHIPIQEHKFEVFLESPAYKHVLTHQQLFARFFVINLPYKLSEAFAKKQKLILYDHEQIDKLPKPKLISNFLDDLKF